MVDSLSGVEAGAKVGERGDVRQIINATGTPPPRAAAEVPGPVSRRSSTDRQEVPGRGSRPWQVRRSRLATPRGRVISLRARTMTGSALPAGGAPWLRAVVFPILVCTAASTVPSVPRWLLTGLGARFTLGIGQLQDPCVAHQNRFSAGCSLAPVRFRSPRGSSPIVASAPRARGRDVRDSDRLRGGAAVEALQGRAYIDANPDRRPAQRDGLGRGPSR